MKRRSLSPNLKLDSLVRSSRVGHAEYDLTYRTWTQLRGEVGICLRNALIEYLDDRRAAP